MRQASIRAAKRNRIFFSTSTSLSGRVGGPILVLGALIATTNASATGLMPADQLANMPTPVNLVMPSGVTHSNAAQSTNSAEAFAAQALANVGALDSMALPAEPTVPSTFENTVREYIGGSEEAVHLDHTSSSIGSQLQQLRGTPTTIGSADTTSQTPAAFSAPAGSYGAPNAAATQAANARTSGTIEPVPAVDLRPINLSSAPSAAFYERLRIDPPVHSDYTVPLEPYRPFAPWLDFKPYFSVHEGAETHAGIAATVFTPLSQTGDSLLFGQLSAQYDGRENFSAAADIGYRKIHGPNFATGFNAGIGFDQSEYTGVTQIRGALGVEAMSRFIDFNLNGYFGESGEKEVATTQSGQAVAGIASTLNSTFTVMTDTVYGNNIESGLSGVSSEVGLSLFDGYRGGAIGNLDFRVAGGGYYFDSLFNPDYDSRRGLFGKTELEWYNINQRYGQGTPRFAIGTEHDYEASANEVHHNFFAKIRIPLHRLTGHSGNSLSRMGDRLVEPVRRTDYRYNTRYEGHQLVASAAQLVGAGGGLSSVAGVVYASQSATGAGTSTAGVAAATPTTIDDALGLTGTASAGFSNIVFLNDDCGSPQSGVAAGCDGLVTASVTGALMQPGQVLLGGGESLTFVNPVLGTSVVVTNPGVGGTISGTGPDGSVASTVLNTASNVWLKGVKITGGSDIGLHIDDDSNVTLENVEVFDIVKSVTTTATTPGAAAVASGDVYGIKTTNSSDIILKDVYVHDIRTEIVANGAAGTDGITGTTGAVGTNGVGGNGTDLSPAGVSTSGTDALFEIGGITWAGSFAPGVAGTGNHNNGYGDGDYGVAPDPVGIYTASGNGTNGLVVGDTGYNLLQGGSGANGAAGTDGTYLGAAGDGTNGTDGGAATATTSAYGIALDSLTTTVTIDNVRVENITAQAQALGGAGGAGGEGSIGAAGGSSTGGDGGMGATGWFGGRGGDGLAGGAGYEDDLRYATIAESTSGNGGDGSDGANGGAGGTGGVGGTGGDGGQAGAGAQGGNGGNGGKGGTATTLAEAYGFAYDPNNTLTVTSLSIENVIASVITEGGTGGAAGNGGVGGVGGDTIAGYGGQGGLGGNGGSGGRGGLGGQGRAKNVEVVVDSVMTLERWYQHGDGGDGGDAGLAGNGGQGGLGGSVDIANAGSGGLGGNAGLSGDAGNMNETANTWGLYRATGGASTANVTFTNVATLNTATAGVGGAAGTGGLGGANGNAVAGIGGIGGAAGENGFEGSAASLVVNLGKGPEASPGVDGNPATGTAVDGTLGIDGSGSALGTSVAAPAPGTDGSVGATSIITTILNAFNSN